jgi:hypothetical protein
VTLRHLVDTPGRFAPGAHLPAFEDIADILEAIGSGRLHRISESLNHFGYTDLTLMCTEFDNPQYPDETWSVDVMTITGTTVNHQYAATTADRAEAEARYRNIACDYPHFAFLGWDTTDVREAPLRPRGVGPSRTFAPK